MSQNRIEFLKEILYEAKQTQVALFNQSISWAEEVRRIEEQIKEVEMEDRIDATDSR